MRSLRTPKGAPSRRKPAGPAIARIIKTAIHPQSGKLSIVRVLSGTIKADATLANITKRDEKVRLGGLYRLQGKKQEPIAEAGPGSIVAFARLDSVSTGDTLTSAGHKVLLPRVPVAEPVFAVAVKPKERIDEAKISQMLARIVDEDPALRLERADVTHEMLLLGSGEQHVAIAVERLARKYKVEVATAAPTIPYLETITGGTEVHSRYKHQTGGHGQFGDVWLRFEPRERGAGVTFEEKIVGGVVPRQFIPAVEKGVREALAHGPSGYPVTDLHVTLFDGQYHDVDSSEQSFKTAAGMGVRDALPKCNPVVLEPIAHVRVIVPTHYTSTVIQQLTGKRGQILGMNPAERPGFDVVEAYVPAVELSRYITELRTRRKAWERTPGVTSATIPFPATAWLPRRRCKVRALALVTDMDASKTPVARSVLAPTSPLFRNTKGMRHPVFCGKAGDFSSPTSVTSRSAGVWG